jgi:NADH-quinone oxidoreductase subunit B
MLHSLLATREFRLAADPLVEVRVLALGLACCAVEVDAAVVAGMLVPADGEPDPESVHEPECEPECEPDREPGGGVRVLVVAGTVTTPLVPAVEAALGQRPPVDAVLAFGACASTGGPYWDAPTVINGVDRIVAVQQYVPGCPPRPEALRDALLYLAGR